MEDKNTFGFSKIIILILFIVFGVPLIIFGSCTAGFISFASIADSFGFGGDGFAAIGYGFIGALLFVALGLFLIIWILIKMFTRKK
jgi:hypothetical protein